MRIINTRYLLVGCGIDMYCAENWVTVDKFLCIERLLFAICTIVSKYEYLQEVISYSLRLLCSAVICQEPLILFDILPQGCRGWTSYELWMLAYPLQK
jgi:hypothetical protein